MLPGPERRRQAQPTRPYRGGVQSGGRAACWPGASPRDAGTG